MPFEARTHTHRKFLVSTGPAYNHKLRNILHVCYPDHDEASIDDAIRAIEEIPSGTTAIVNIEVMKEDR